MTITARKNLAAEDEKRTTIIRKPHLRGRGPHFPVLDTIVQYDFEPGYVAFTMPSPKRIRVLQPVKKSSSRGSAPPCRTR